MCEFLFSQLHCLLLEPRSVLLLGTVVTPVIFFLLAT
jgi:hypothetical protein